MNSDNFLSELRIASEAMKKISTALKSPQGITDNPPYEHLKDKMEIFCLSSMGALMDLKTKEKIQRREGKKASYHKVAK